MPRLHLYVVQDSDRDQEFPCGVVWGVIPEIAQDAQLWFDRLPTGLNTELSFRHQIRLTNPLFQGRQAPLLGGGNYLDGRLETLELLERH
ncbi:MAG: hypothetical protein GY906_34510 [bacterium]|nr:hypothetical protein [bacterium]